MKGVKLPSVPNDDKDDSLDERIFSTAATPIPERTETAEAMESLDKDTVDANGMTSMDTNSILSESEIKSTLIFDTFTRMGILDIEEIAFTRQLKRLSPSKNGIGRTQKVEIAGAIRNNKSGGDFGSKFARWISPRQNI